MSDIIPLQDSYSQRNLLVYLLILSYSFSFTSANFFLTSLNIHSQTFHYPIYIMFLPYISLATSFFQLSYSAINLFYFTKYFTIPFAFFLFKIFSTSHSLTPFTSTSFTSIFFCPST